MQFSNQLLFFFSALGAFNGLLLAVYLFFIKPNSINNKLLATLLVAISLRISKSVWMFFDPNIGKQFLQLGLSACFFIGPLLYFFCASASQQLNQLRLNWQLHLGLLALLTLSVGVLFPYQNNVDLWAGVFYKVINWSWLLYLVASLRFVAPVVVNKIKNNKAMTTDEVLMINVYFGSFVVWLAYFTASYTSYIVGALSFSFVLYLMVLIGFINKKQKAPVRYAEKKISKDTEQALLTQLNTLMLEQQLFKDANLSLPALAKKMRVSVPTLSQLLNDNLRQSFATYVNYWRVKEAKSLLLSNHHLTMELVAEQSGYNSQSTFYSAFKQFEDCTPAKYRKKQSSKTPEL